MKGLLIKNRYYTDAGLDYVRIRLGEEFGRRGVALAAASPTLVYDENGRYATGAEDADFVLFWDKDTRLSRAFEKDRRVFNSTDCLTVCDDKEKTYAALEGSGIAMPATVAAPLAFEVSDSDDHELYEFVESALGYPMVVKADVGSLGRQVFLAEDRRELVRLHLRMKSEPHQFQKFMGRYGSDIRLYVLGGEVIAACERTNTLSFKSNVAAGGAMKVIDPPADFVAAARKAASLLKMDYGSIDFLYLDTPVFLEANSNAYFRAIEGLGVDIAGKYAEYVIEVLCSGKTSKN